MYMQKICLFVETKGRTPARRGGGYSSKACGDRAVLALAQPEREGLHVQVVPLAQVHLHPRGDMRLQKNAVENRSWVPFVIF